MLKRNHYAPRLVLIPVILLFTIALLYFKRHAATLIPLQLLPLAFMDAELKYQIITLALSGVLVLLCFLLARLQFHTYFAWGKSWGRNAAKVEAVPLLGIKAEDNETWQQVGRNFAIIISSVTAIIIYFQVLKGAELSEKIVTLLPLSVLFAASNAFVEETITRFGVVCALEQLVPKQAILLTSAFIFGTVHYLGVPGGWAGVVAAGFLGWLLAKSILETQGLFWAWFIHFLQDVIIFTGLFISQL